VGVIGHEIGHVALRHGTNQASKAAVTQGIAQGGLAILGGVIGTNSLGGIIANLATGFGANSILLKYSRDAERQADLAGTYLLYDNP
jgi:predicted Zn-dependent protease